MPSFLGVHRTVNSKNYEKNMVQLKYLTRVKNFYEARYGKYEDLVKAEKTAKGAKQNEINKSLGSEVIAAQEPAIGESLSETQTGDAPVFSATQTLPSETSVPDDATSGTSTSLVKDLDKISPAASTPKRVDAAASAPNPNKTPAAANTTSLANMSPEAANKDKVAKVSTRPPITTRRHVTDPVIPAKRDQEGHEKPMPRMPSYRTMCLQEYVNHPCPKEHTDCPYLHDAQMDHYGVDKINGSLPSAEYWKRGGLNQPYRGRR